MTTTLENYGTDFRERLFRPEDLDVENSINNYFNERLFASNLDIRIVNGRLIADVSAGRGYVFTQSLAGKTYSEILQDAIGEKKGINCNIEREFQDHKLEFAGFMWRQI